MKYVIPTFSGVIALMLILFQISDVRHVYLAATERKKAGERTPLLERCADASVLIGLLAMVAIIVAGYRPLGILAVVFGMLIWQGTGWLTWHGSLRWEAYHDRDEDEHGDAEHSVTG